jgi:prepilin-type N-terminal cleavage/methylation domain-containing protein
LKRPERHRRPSDEGFTLTELLVVLIVFGILSTAVMITMTNTLGIVNQTSATYTGVNQVLNLSTVLEKLVRSEVEPGPSAAANPYPTPVPGFVASGTTATSMTFYSDVGNTLGPALVVAAESTVPNVCTGKCPIPTYSFTVTETAPTTGTCPTTTNGSPTTTRLVCAYSPSKAKRVASIDDVANTSTQPIFTYTILNAGSPQTITPTQLSAGFFSSCTPSANLAVSCPSDAIQSVAFSFIIAVQGAPSAAAYNTTAYRLSSTSFAYSPGVG